VLRLIKTLPHLPSSPFLLQAFKSYDEAGVGRRVQCLKYLVLAYMLMESNVDPFDAQEAKPYKQVRAVNINAHHFTVCNVIIGMLSYSLWSTCSFAAEQ
jgi:hypothetical protein